MSKQPKNRSPLRLYLAGLGTYLYFRLMALIEAMFLAPRRLVSWLSEPGRSRLRSWLVRQRWRLIWSLLGLMLLTGFVGGAVVIAFWRAELIALLGRFRERVVHLVEQLAKMLGTLRRRPVVRVVPQQAQTVIKNEEFRLKN